jgi:hypothetical protein
MKSRFHCKKLKNRFSDCVRCHLKQSAAMKRDHDATIANNFECRVVVDKNWRFYQPVRMTTFLPLQPFSGLTCERP